MFVSIATNSFAQSYTLPQIWLAPVDPLLRSFNGVHGPADYPDLFSPDAPWSTVAGKVKVFKLYSTYVRSASDAQLTRIFVDLKRRGIALAVESGVLVATQACGQGVEGYDGAGLVPLAQRITRLGGELRFVAMDEPLWHGVYYHGRNACSAAPDAVAQQVAATLQALHQVSPATETGDIEPFPLADPPDWQDQILRWSRIFQASTGHPLAFLHIDVLRNNPRWAARTRALGGALRQQGITFGVIYNGTAADLSDATWAADTRKEYSTFEAGGSAPDQAIFQSWMSFPTHVLPDSAPDTLTGIISDYLRTPDTIAATRHGDMISVRLVDPRGAPIAGARVEAEAADSTAGREAQLIMPGIVPPMARSALFALRVNTECDNCAGEGVISLGAASFLEGSGGAAAVVAQAWNAGGGPPRFNLRRGQPVTLNSAAFTVTPGAQFAARFIVRADPGLAGGGYLGVIFRDSAGREIVRSQLPLQAAWHVVASASTDRSGQASFDRTTRGTSPSWRFRFAGDRQYRPAETTVP